MLLNVIATLNKMLLNVIAFRICSLASRLALCTFLSPFHSILFYSILFYSILLSVGMWDGFLHSTL